jgi:DNA-binding transcriptional LysR family regulator
VSVELKHLRAFVAVAEELNFTRAAERLHLAQQALSTQIRQLEERVGERLLERTTRKVELTPAGEALLEHARSVLGGADRAVAAARAAGGDGPCRLTVGFLVPADHEPMLETLNLFSEARPEVEVRIHFGEVVDPSAGLRDGLADIAVVVGAFDHTGLETLHLWTDPRGVALGARHPLAAKEEISIAEMIDEPTFDFKVPDPIYRDFWMATAHRGGRPPKLAAQFRGLDGLLEAVRAGLGLNLIRERIVQTLGPDSGVVYRPVKGLEPAHVSLAWLEGNESELVADVVGAARQAFDIEPDAEVATPPTD